MSKRMTVTARTIVLFVACVLALITTASAASACNSERVMGKSTTYARLLASRAWVACAEEDSVWCHWDARSHGNGKGPSFIAVRYGERTEVYRSNGTHATYYGTPSA